MFKSLINTLLISDGMWQYMCLGGGYSLYADFYASLLFLSDFWTSGTDEIKDKKTVYRAKLDAVTCTQL